MRDLDEAKDYWDDAYENTIYHRQDVVDEYAEEFSNLPWYRKTYWWVRMKWASLRGVPNEQSDPDNPSE